MLRTLVKILTNETSKKVKKYLYAKNLVSSKFLTVKFSKNRWYLKVKKGWVNRLIYSTKERIYFTTDFPVIFCFWSFVG